MVIPETPDIKAQCMFVVTPLSGRLIWTLHLESGFYGGSDLHRCYREAPVFSKAAEVLTVGSAAPNWNYVANRLSQAAADSDNCKAVLLLSSLLSCWKWCCRLTHLLDATGPLLPLSLPASYDVLCLSWVWSRLAHLTQFLIFEGKSWNSVPGCLGLCWAAPAFSRACATLSWYVSIFDEEHFVLFFLYCRVL